MKQTYSVYEGHKAGIYRDWVTVIRNVGKTTAYKKRRELEIEYAVHGELWRDLKYKVEKD